MQIYNPEFFNLEQAKALKSYYHDMIRGKQFGSEYYSKIKGIQIVLINNRCMIRVWAHDKEMYMDLSTCAKSLDLISPKDYLKENNLL